MKNITRIFCCLFVLLTMVSCGSGKPIVLQNETTKTITETVHDTVFKIEKDNSFYEALLECQNGKVVVKEVTQTEPGRNLKSPKVRVENNKLSVDCEVRAQELLAHYISTHETVNTAKTLPPIEVNKLTFLQELQIWCGRLFLLCVLFFGIKLILKSYNPFNYGK
jgi:hypothetical protein